MILVTGSTGNVGASLVRELAKKGVPTRALVHTSEKMGAVEREGVEVMVGDFGASETLDTALEGVEHAFLLTPPDLRQPEWENNFVKAAERAGIRHVVKQSVQGADANSPTQPRRERAAPRRVGYGLDLSASQLVHADHARLRAASRCRGEVLRPAR